MIKQASRFAVTGRARESSHDDAPRESDFDEREMEAAMREMESEMEAIDEQGDPRRLAHMMRRLSEASGEKMPAAMHEMIARMEAGEDPEKLDEEYGELLEQDAEPREREVRSGKREACRTRGELRPAPHRDPALYEMAEYI